MMEQDRELHWYMRPEAQSFSLIPTEERNPEYDRKFHYLGKMTGPAANRKAYSKLHDITDTLQELERTVGGTE